MSTPQLVRVAAPGTPVYRVAHGPDPFRPIPWSVVRLRTPGIVPRHVPAQLGGRFDDPALPRGRQYPEARRFRTLYFATDPAGAFVEAMQTFSRWDKPLISPGLADVIAADARLQALINPTDPRRGIVPWSWFRPRVFGATQLAAGLVFVDVAASGTLHYLRPVLAPLLAKHGLHHLGYSVVVGPIRALTQAIAGHVFEYIREHDADPPFAGVRYASDLDPQHECWAVFASRVERQHDALTAFDGLSVRAWQATPGLWRAAHFLELDLEAPDGRLYRPEMTPAGTFSVV